MNDAPVTIMGSLTRDPELRFTNSGMAVAEIGVAVNYRKLNKRTNEWDEDVSFFDVTCFGQMAENIGESLVKGNRVVVHGRLNQDTWTTDNGDKRSKVKIVADEVAASLRFATAHIERAERRGVDDNGGRQQSNSRQQQPGPFDEDWGGGEEPF